MKAKISIKQALISIRSITHKGTVVWALEKVYGSHMLDSKLQELRNLPKGTVGWRVAQELDSKGYSLIPKFMDHDLKHIILEYRMTPVDEIRMQAYLFGNGNYSLPCVGSLLLSLLYPSIWSDLIAQYKLGRSSKSIYYLKLDECMHRNLKEVQVEYGRMGSEILEVRRAMPRAGILRPFRA